MDFDAITCMMIAHNRKIHEYPMDRVNYVEKVDMYTNETFYDQIVLDIYWINQIRIPVEYDLCSLLDLEITTKYTKNIKWKISVSLLVHLVDVVKTNTHYVIELPKKLFTNDPKFEGLVGKTFDIQITSDYRIPYSMMVHNTFMDSSMSDLIKYKDNFYKIKLFDTFELNNQNSVQIESQSICTGFFIETDSKIKKFQLIYSYLNKNEEIKQIMLKNLDNDMFDYTCKTIPYHTLFIQEHDKALYECLDMLPGELIWLIKKLIPKRYVYWIPIDPCTEWNVIGHSNINLSKYTGDNRCLKIVLNGSHTGKIHCMVHNVMIMQKYTGDLKYPI
jgi:hypothetical protein